MATVKKLTTAELKKVILEEKRKLGLLSKKITSSMNESALIKRQVMALNFLKERAESGEVSAEALEWISEARIKLKRALLRRL